MQSSSVIYSTLETGAMTLSVMALSITTFSVITLSITAVSIMGLILRHSIKTLIRAGKSYRERT
jgi:hypothetical protein